MTLKIALLNRLFLIIIAALLAVDLWRPVPTRAASSYIKTRVVQPGNSVNIGSDDFMGFSCLTDSVCVVASR